MTDREETPYSPAGFEAPDVEVEDGLVRCAGCGETAPASEMGLTADVVDEVDGATTRVERRYLHNSGDCMTGFFQQQEGASDE